MKCDGTRADTRFRRNGRVHLNRRGTSVQSTTGSRGVRVSGSNAGYIMFLGSVKSTGYPLHSPVSPSLSLPYVTVCHHIFMWSIPGVSGHLTTHWPLNVRGKRLSRPQTRSGSFQRSLCPRWDSNRCSSVAQRVTHVTRNRCSREAE